MIFKRFSSNMKYKDIVRIKKNRANEYYLLYYYLNNNIFCYNHIKFYCLNI